MTETAAPTLVRLEFGRVQTWLFSVPDLRSMIGANTRLGEVLRGRLEFADGQPQFVPCLDPSSRNRTALPADNLPALACECGAALPNVNVDRLHLPAPHRDDPLSGAGGRDGRLSDIDDPAAACRLGILARDGGHFHAVFPDSDSADRFLQQARQLVAGCLPGLPVSVRVSQLQMHDGAWQLPPEDRAGVEPTESAGRSLFQLPQLQLCRVSGDLPATDETCLPGDSRKSPVSTAVRLRHEATDRFNQQRSSDVISLLRDAVTTGIAGVDIAADEKSQQELYPRSFDEVSPSGYLAVIAADGNDIGSQSTAAAEGKSNSRGDYFAGEAKREHFFHSTRFIVRRALVTALVQTFTEAYQTSSGSDSRVRLPFRLLMQGGDDLLLVCDAPYAAPFVLAYGRELDRLSTKAVSNRQREKPLTVGVGMAIVRQKFPFHRAHALAEELLDSAKRLYRERKAGGLPTVSTVDWLSVSEGWHDDLRDVRRRDFRQQFGSRGRAEETLLLSARPYRLLDSGHEQGTTLDSLWTLAENIRADGRLPRSKIRGLAEVTSRGRLRSNWFLETRAEELCQPLAAVLTGQARGQSIWEPVGSGVWLTKMLDFVELYELARRPSSRGSAGNGLNTQDATPLTEVPA